MNNDPICLFSSLCAPLPPALKEICLNQTLEEQRGAGTVRVELTKPAQTGRSRDGAVRITILLKRKSFQIVNLTGCVCYICGCVFIRQHIKVQPFMNRHSRIVMSQKRFKGGQQRAEGNRLRSYKKVANEGTLVLLCRLMVMRLSSTRKPGTFPSGLCPRRACLHTLFALPVPAWLVFISRLPELFNVTGC